MKGIYNCPLTSVGYLILCRGQKCKFMASLKIVNDPLIRAWLATMATIVAIVIPMGRNAWGMMA